MAIASRICFLIGTSFMRTTFLALFAILFLQNATAADTLPIWPGTAPGSENWTWSEESSTQADGTIGTVRNVVKPSLVLYRPDVRLANGTAILVFPGGGFQNLAYGKEGDGIAKWLNSLGITAIVVKYRVAHSQSGETLDNDTKNERTKATIPLAVQDAKQAMRVVRQHAKEWDLKPDKIGVMGFSAGGYLAIALGASSEAETKPDFVAGIYPGSPGTMAPTHNSPPLFIAVAADDFLPPTMRALDAWTKVEASVELHLYAKGGHGFALRKEGLPVNSWTDRFIDWMKWLKIPVSPAP